MPRRFQRRGLSDEGARRDTLIALNVLPAAGYADGNYDCTFFPTLLGVLNWSSRAPGTLPNLAAGVLDVRSRRVRRWQFSKLLRCHRLATLAVGTDNQGETTGTYRYGCPHTIPSRVCVVCN